MNKVLTWIRHPNVFFRTLNNHGLLTWIDDEFALKMIYKFMMHKSLNLNPPITFNEKMQWLKLYDRKEIYTTMVDKYAVKGYVAERIGEQYIIPVYDSWDSPADIDVTNLPDRFVIKCNHGSGFNWVCKDKDKLDVELLRKKCTRWMRISGYWFGREWPYKNVRKKIFAEKYVENPGDENLVVYKVFCMNGHPELLQVIQDDKAENETIDYFDCEWRLLNLYQDHPNSITHLDKPQCLDHMLDLSATLSTDIPFVRVDWYEVEGKLLFSEFTFYSDSGFAPFHPEQWDKRLGDKIQINIAK